MTTNDKFFEFLQKEELETRQQDSAAIIAALLIVDAWEAKLPENLCANAPNYLIQTLKDALANLYYVVSTDTLCDVIEIYRKSGGKNDLEFLGGWPVDLE